MQVQNIVFPWNLTAARLNFEGGVLCGEIQGWLALEGSFYTLDLTSAYDLWNTTEKYKYRYYTARDSLLLKIDCLYFKSSESQSHYISV